MSTDLVLVLDDYHVIDARDIHDGMVFLLDHLPPRPHLVIASRADPPLPLARLRARGPCIGPIRTHANCNLAFEQRPRLRGANATSRLGLLAQRLERTIDRGGAHLSNMLLDGYWKLA